MVMQNGRITARRRGSTLPVLHINVDVRLLLVQCAPSPRQ
jgi:hypothetical protein